MGRYEVEVVLEVGMFKMMAMMIKFMQLSDGSYNLCLQKLTWAHVRLC